MCRSGDHNFVIAALDDKCRLRRLLFHGALANSSDCEVGMYLTAVCWTPRPLACGTPSACPFGYAGGLSGIAIGDSTRGAAHGCAAGWCSATHGACTSGGCDRLVRPRRSMWNRGNGTTAFSQQRSHSSVWAGLWKLHEACRHWSASCRTSPDSGGYAHGRSRTSPLLPVRFDPDPPSGLVGKWLGVLMMRQQKKQPTPPWRLNVSKQTQLRCCLRLIT